MIVSMLLCGVFVGGPGTDRPVPLTAVRITKLQQVVRRTQDRNAELKEALDDRQQELMKAYSQFELDEARISQLHEKVIDLQRGFLENYRDLQVEIRDIVGEKRFAQLKMRIDLILKGKKKVQVSPGTSPHGAAEERKSKTDYSSPTRERGELR